MRGSDPKCLGRHVHRTLDYVIPPSAVAGPAGKDATAHETTKDLVLSSDHGSVDLGLLSQFQRITFSAPGRLRIYVSEAARVADLSRPLAVDATAGTGCLLEVNPNLVDGLGGSLTPLFTAAPEKGGDGLCYWTWDGALGTTCSLEYYNGTVAGTTIVPKDGNTVHSEPRDPAQTDGISQDAWINTLTWDVWKKDAGSWAPTGNIKGDAGPTGATGAAGAGGYPPWSPDRPPASPDALDDEFTSDQAGWSWVNQGTATYLVTASRLVIAAPPVAGDQMRCRVRSISASAWSITAKICVQPQSLTNYVQGGLILRNSSTGKLVGLAMVWNSSQGVGGWQLMFDQFNSAASFNSTTAATSIEIHELYLRLASDGASLRAYYSVDGLVYTLFYTQALAAFIGSVDQFGLYAGSTNTASAVDVICDWIRKDWTPTES